MEWNRIRKKNDLDNEAGVYAQTGFEYQTMIITNMSLMMYVGLDGLDIIERIYSELADDVLLETRDKKLIVIQVTYNNFNTPFGLNDPKIIKSLNKFIQIKTKYKDAIESFKIISNTGFKRVLI